jgi:protoporphyrinogen oxidase
VNRKKVAIIIGAGPAGLTAAYELVRKTDIKPIIYEMSEHIGGIARTVNYKGNRIDIGGHRFFSKSDRVMEWWQNILPLQRVPSENELELNINYHNQTRKQRLTKDGPDPDKVDKVMLIRRRLSRIYYLRKFFDYPVSLNFNTLFNLGLFRIVRILFSYIKARVFPRKQEISLEDFLINRFGGELYHTFFKDYTEKVWGVSCSKISAEWGAQRIKGLSVTKTVIHAIKKIIKKDSSISQKDRETSLIERFLYPKYGPGQLWEEVASTIIENGGSFYSNHKATKIYIKDNKISGIEIRNETTGEISKQEGDYFFSTMPIKEFIESIESDVPPDVTKIAQGLVYRDFITLGMLLTKLKIKNISDKQTVNDIIPDNWIYIQEKEVSVGRLQIYNNWSSYMVKDPNKVWLGLEYFCNEGDELWNKSDEEFIDFAINELVEIDIIEKEDVLDSTIIRMPKTYPAYFGTYNDFHIIRDFTDKIENLFLIGRNGMHKYNNQDHSMLTAMTAVENIINNITDKSNIWAINTEDTYIEEK